MRLLYFLCFFLILSGCSYDKVTYWCGDHPCINKNEKEAYFKKTMIVEVREFDKKKIKENSEIEKILLQARDKEKTRIKNEKSLSKIEKLEQKRKINEQKTLAKKQKKIEKKRLKEEKALAKQIKKDEKSNARKVKKETKRNKKLDDSKKTTIQQTNFQKIVQEINKRNIFRDYPDINDIPN